MTGHAVELERVSERIGAAVEAFCADVLTLDPPRFIADDLRRHVARVVGPSAPGSADRILRMLRQRGRIAYEVIDRRGSIYELRRPFAPVGPHLSQAPGSATPPSRAVRGQAPTTPANGGGLPPTTNPEALPVAARGGTCRAARPGGGDAGTTSLLDDEQMALLGYLEGLG